MTNQNVDLTPNFPKFRNLVIKVGYEFTTEVALISTFASSSFDWSNTANSIKKKYAETLMFLNRLHNALPSPYGHQLVFKDYGIEITSSQLLKMILRTCNCCPAGAYVEFKNTRFDSLRLENFKAQIIRKTADGKYYWTRVCKQTRICPWCHFRYFIDLAKRLLVYSAPMRAYNALVTVYGNPYDFRKRMQKALLRTYKVDRYWIDMQPVTNSSNEWNIVLITIGGLRPFQFEDDNIRVDLVRSVEGLPTQIVKHWLCARMQFDWSVFNSINSYVQTINKTRDRDRLSTNEDTAAVNERIKNGYTCEYQGPEEFIAETTQTGTTRVKPISGFNLIEKLK